MKALKVSDCKRDQKGVHDWKLLREGADPTFWCRACGAIGKGPYPIVFHNMKVVDRIRGNG